MTSKRVTLITFEIKDGYKAIDFLIALVEFSGGMTPTLEIETERNKPIIRILVDEDCFNSSRDFKMGYFKALRS